MNLKIRNEIKLTQRPRLYTKIKSGGIFWILSGGTGAYFRARDPGGARGANSQNTTEPGSSDQDLIL